MACIHLHPRSLSDIGLRHVAKMALADARPQAPKNWGRIRWNTLRIFWGREQNRCLRIVRRNRMGNVGQAPGMQVNACHRCISWL
jgi:hypothetical protein